MQLDGKADVCRWMTALSASPSPYGRRVPCSLFTLSTVLSCPFYGVTPGRQHDAGDRSGVDHR